jgi:hypothetical protein
MREEQQRIEVGEEVCRIDAPGDEGPADSNRDIFHDEMKAKREVQWEYATCPYQVW